MNLKSQTNMNIKKQLGIPLLFLLMVAFTGCNDDDNTENHMVLPVNSCEVMQWQSTTINLTPNKNCSLSFDNPELIDATYIGDLGNNKARIEIKGKQVGETKLTITDHETGESATIMVKVTKYPMPQLGVKQSAGNIFDNMSFYLYMEDGQTINSNVLSKACDSIVWTAEGVKGSFRVYEHQEGEGKSSDKLTLKWDHCFKYSGEYKIHLTAWKNNKAIYNNQLDVSIADRKDFLGYNWNEITKESQAWNTYVDVFKSSPDLMTTYGLSGTVPYIEMRVWNCTLGQSGQILYDYLCKFYSAPTYNDQTEKQEIFQRYKELFSEQKKHAMYPVDIWVTKNANIVLLMQDESTENPGYVVYAEPNT